MSELDWNKVGVIHNTQYADSQDVAEYYATARSIPPGNVQGFALGTASSYIGSDDAARDAYRTGVLTDIRNWIVANGIEAVALSINAPLVFKHNPTLQLGVGGPPYVTAQGGSFCRAISACDKLVTLGGTTPHDAQYTSMVVTTNYWGGTPGVHKYSFHHKLDSWRNATVDGGYTHVLCGRLGAGVGVLSAADVALSKQIIDDAIWFEQNGDPANEPFLFGMSQRVWPLEHGNVYGAWRELRRHLNNVEIYDGNFDGGASHHDGKAGAWFYKMPPITIKDQVKWLSGGGPVKDIWGWLGTGHTNHGDVYLPSVKFRRGAFMFESTSSRVSQYSLLNGACAAICPVHEPLSTGLPEITGLARALRRGFTMEEARALSQRVMGGGNAVCGEVWGDPFYAPFKNLARRTDGGIGFGF